MKKNRSQNSLSPENYIRKRARTLPLGPCYINEAWKESGMAMIIVTRKHITGNFTFAMIQVDLYCLGVKEAFYSFNATQDDLSEIIRKQSEMTEYEDKLIEADYTLVHNIIYGSIEYAGELGFHPAKDFSIAKFILEEDDDHIELIDIEFGREGKPAVVFGMEKHPDNIIKQLDKTVGTGNYTVIQADDETGQDRVQPDEEKEDIIDKPFEEMENEELRTVFEGKKQMTPVNIFKLVFASYTLLLKKKEKKEIEKIMDNINEWNIIDGIDSEEKQFSTEEEKKLYYDLYFRARSEPGKTIQSIYEAIVKFPDSFHIHSLLGMAYMQQDSIEDMHQLTIQLYQKYPDNLFAFCNFVTMLIAIGEIGEAELLLHDSYNIHEQFPKMDNFTFDQYLAYIQTIAKYFLKTGKLVKAAAYVFPLTFYEWREHNKAIVDTLYLLVIDYIKEKIMPENQMTGD